MSDTGTFIAAAPIWAAGREKDQNMTVGLRAALGFPKTATLRIATSGIYRFFVDGEFAGAGPARGPHGHFRVDEWELNHPGTVAVEVVGYNLDNYYVINQPSFVQAELVGGGEVLASTGGQGIELTALTGRLSDVTRYSHQRAFLEVYRLAPGYDAWRKGGAMPRAEIGVQEAKNYLPRRVAYPEFPCVAPRNLDSPILDFGTNLTGFLGATVRVEAETRLDFFFDEILDSNGDVDPSRLTCANVISYHLAPGEYSLESMEPYTLRYLKIVGGACRVGNVYLREYANSEAFNTHFNSDDHAVNRIFAAGRETFRQNALDIFMDCPSRERAGWLCDSFFTARTALSLTGNTLIERNFLENFLLPDKYPKLPDGMLPMCYPADHPNGNFIPQWALWFVLELEEYAKRGDNLPMALALETKVMALLKFLEAFENADGLLEKLPGWNFIEWSKANEFVQDVNYPTNMLHAKALEVAGRLYGAPSLLDKADRVRAKIREQSFDGEFFVDNAVRENGVLNVTRNKSEVCQYYAFYFGVAAPESHPELWAKLRDHFGPSRTTAFPGIHKANAFIGNFLRFELLSKHGCCLQLLDEAKAYFLKMAETTGTLWENNDSRASCNHGFASHVCHVFLRDVLGLHELDLKHKTVTLRFSDLPLKCCAARLPLGDDFIQLSWVVEDGRLLYKITLPPGFTHKAVNNGVASIALGK